MTPRDFDLRTAAERERDDAAALHLRCDKLAEALDYQTRRSDTLERTLLALVDRVQIQELRIEELERNKK